ncbi:glycosyltransferase [Limobrevibacterium gyesilva]|uniref:Glycosyltransferase n=1 Tax=Limobrevibacterium gyesilva TaxID=2991712 RepID=A0AA41YNY8_9PROT|nr:glycosyltransferase [Limobrevibacterium gyesilva]MCW3475588.1 glycosyltransferase [Limobrevibacterium gyesilva]
MTAACPPRDILFATWEGGGNVPPILSAIRQMVARGHRVRLIADSVIGPEAMETGAAFTPWRRAPNRTDRSSASDTLRDWEAGSGLEGFERLRDTIMCGPALAQAQDVLDELARRPADLIVGNELLFGVMTAAEASGTPLVLLCPNISVYPLPGMPPMGLGLLPARTPAEQEEHARIQAGFADMLNGGLPSVNAARMALGLGPLHFVGDQAAIARRVLLATSPDFDFQAAWLPPPVRYVGPLLGQPAWAGDWESPWPDLHPDPLVLVAFSTTFQNQGATIEAIATALGDLPVRGLVTTGPGLGDAPLPTPPNVVIVPAAPHDEVMRRARVVVTHGGHGTVIRALSHGVPLLVLPMGRDQHDNAARVVSHGAGLELPRDAAPEQIRAALLRLLHEPSFHAAASRLSGAIAAPGRTASLVEEIEEAAAPAVRPGPLAHAC